MIHRATRRALLPIVLLIAAAACGKKDDTTLADTSTIAPAPSAVPAALRVSSIDTGKGLNADKTLRDNTDDFGVRDTIYVSVKTDGASSGSKLAAKWTFQDGQTVGESTQDIAPTGGEAVHEFRLAKATAWPAGKYKVEIILDGTSAGSKDFEIK